MQMNSMWFLPQGVKQLNVIKEAEERDYFGVGSGKEGQSWRQHFELTLKELTFCEAEIKGGILDGKEAQRLVLGP